MRYIYESLQAVAKETKERADLTSAELISIPRVWIDKLRKAAVAADGEQCFLLLHEIKSEHPSIAAGIETMIDAFEFDRILSLVEGTIRLLD